MKSPCPVWLEWDSDLLNSVIPTGTDHREEMICGAEDLLFKVDIDSTRRHENTKRGLALIVR